MLKFKTNIRMGRKDDLSDFACGMVVGARWAGPSPSETADLLRFFFFAQNHLWGLTEHGLE